MRAVRLSALAAVAGAVAVLAPSHGLSTSTSAKANGACGRQEFVSGLEAVFGRRKTLAQAQTLRNQVTAKGFVNANIIEGCNDFRVVVRGIETFDIGVEFQTEATRSGYRITLECIQAKPLGRYEAIFGHGRDRPSATAILNRAAAAGYQGLKLRSDPCGGFEVYLAGFTSFQEAEVFRGNAKDKGFDVVIERN